MTAMVLTIIIRSMEIPELGSDFFLADKPEDGTMGSEKRREQKAKLQDVIH